MESPHPLQQHPLSEMRTPEAYESMDSQVEDEYSEDVVSQSKGSKS